MYMHGFEQSHSISALNEFSNTICTILLTIKETKHFGDLTNIPAADISIETRGIAECLV